MSGVPPEWFGRTDTVLTLLTDPRLDPVFGPPFTRAAIVPVPVPEPGALALGLLGAVALLSRLYVKHRINVNGS